MCLDFTQELTPTPRRAYLIIRRASVEVLEGGDDVLAEAWREHVLLLAKLVPRLTHNRIDDVQTGDLVLRLALWKIIKKHMTVKSQG